MSYFWRERITITTVIGQAWYDLRTTGTGQSFFAGTLKDRDLITEAQHHFLEPIGVDSRIPNNQIIRFIGSGQAQDLTTQLQEALQARQNQFLFETGLIRTRETLSGLTIPGSGRFQVDTDIVDIRRLSWQDLASSTYRQLERTDETALSSFMPNWQAPGDPLTFSTMAAPSLRIQFAPPPANKGTLDMVSTKLGPVLDNSVGVALGVPDTYAHTIKWGAMADVLSIEGEFRDPLRAEYCELRYKQGTELARMQPALLHAEISGRTLQITSLSDLDAYKSGWENASQAQPTSVATTGLNLLTLNPIPDAVYMITLDIVRPAPFPVFPVDNSVFVDVGGEHLETLVDYAQHIASFKQGGLEFQMTGKQYGNMIEQAAKLNAKLRGNATFAIPTFGQQQEDESRDIIRDDKALGTLT